MSNKRQFDILIVNYNSTNCLIDCLRSVYSSIIDATFNIVIIDNSLKDETAEIRNHFKDIHIIANQKNIGFAAGINQGIRLSRSEYIFLLNPDTIISSTFFMPMIEYMDKNPDIGIMGPKILSADGSFQTQSRRSFPTLFRYIDYVLRLYKLFPKNNITTIENLISKVFGKITQKRIEQYRIFLSVRNPLYLKWAIYNALHWKQKETLSNILHIHGTQDHIFPIKNISNCIEIKGGTHVMILNKAKEISSVLLNSLN